MAEQDQVEPASEVKKRRWVRRLVVAVGVYTLVSLVAVFVAFLLGWATFARSLPELSGWHKETPNSEFTARDEKPGFGLDDYLRQEERTFKELDSLIDNEWKHDAERVFNRFNRSSVCFPGTGFDLNWNRTIVLDAPSPRGGALLVHGLSDSPYSLRTAAERIRAGGWTVVSLRVPGHGTCPGALAKSSWRDWAAAVRVAAKGLRSRIPADAPLVLFGYSNGGALCVDYTLDALGNSSLPKPDAIVLFSPMVGITPFAKITRLHHLIAWIPGFEMVRWAQIEEEVDPYKYGSWPTNASEQAFLLTSRLASRLAAVTSGRGNDRLPPVLTFQSVVDSTIRVPDLMRNLYERLPRGPSELVLFDLNRIPLLHDLLRNNNEPFIRSRMEDPNLGYRLTLVTDGVSGMVARLHDGPLTTETVLDLRWPAEVFSLSHGAVPIPPDDPILGTREATESFPGPNLGSIHLRGEHGVLRISESFTIRLRHNPFYPFVAEKTDTWLREVLGEAAP